MSILKVRAFANNAITLIGWQADPQQLAGCLGFEITRIYDDDSTRILAAWVPFEGQSNPDWQPQDTSVWPVQKFTWRDLTVRQRRDQAELRPAGDPVRYRIRPVCALATGLAPVPASAAPPYQGVPVPLSYMDSGTVTERVTPSTTLKSFDVAFNSGILSTQWLSHAVQRITGHAASARTLVPLIREEGPIRNYLAGDLPSLVHQMFADLQPDEHLYIALYELTDEELIGLILQHAEQVHLILSNTGADKDSGAWDAENEPYRARLHAAVPALAEMHDRMFNNAQHIGHNKFVVRVDGHGQAQSVLSGSTNWTPNGLCAQSNNMYIARVPDLARQFLDYWQSIKRDNALFTVPEPLSEGTKNVQGTSLRQQNALALDEVATDSGKLRLWRSPNTKQVSKPAKSPALPPDLAEVFGYVRQAKRAIFFAVFLPSQQGLNSIVSEAVDIARKDTSLLVYGAVSSPLAMPNYIPPQHAASGDDADNGDKYQPSLFDEGKVHVVRANALNDDLVGNFEKEVLSAGNAIIHDKLIVIDPLSDDCTVIVGSHNLGFKASYANDDNLLIIRGDRRLAEAYMVHALDLYEHYHFRAVQYERRREGRESWSGFLSTDDHWLAKYPDGGSDLSQYLVS